MGQDLEGFLGMSAISIGIGAVGSVLAVFWLRTTQGEWPDKDDIVVLMKVFFGIGGFGLVAYLMMKYG